MKKLRSPKYLVCTGIACVTAITLFAGFLNRSSSGGYTAHEWGTFTSVQGGDGALLDWRPLETSRLPGFVYNWNHPGLNRQMRPTFGKAGMIALQRMETPVIYFYSDHAQSVNVSVDFPKGIITEWYPQAKQIGPSSVPIPPAVVKADNAAHRVGAKPEFTFESWLDKSSTRDSRALWAHVEILKANSGLESSLMTDRSGSHYFAARETDANFLRVASLAATNPAPELEKFIFYRGVGNFKTPLFVTTKADHTVTIMNNGSEPLDHLFLLDVEKQAGSFIHVPQLGPGEQRSLKVDTSRNVPIGQLSTKLGDELAKSLVGEGLYAREARAMVNTWKDSWFGENGMRVLYVLPRAWTDRTLPAKFDPSPRDLVRVMVGRAEIIPPDQQNRLREAITKASDGDAASREQLVAEFRKLGRFSEPALSLALRQAPQAASRTAWDLLQVASKQVSETKPL